MNPDVQVHTHEARVGAENILEVMSGYDFVVDGTDNFPAKYLINDACVITKKPYSHAGILRFNGQTMTVLPGESACLRCIFPEPPPPDAVPTCSQAGVLGVLAGVLGTLQATEVLKYTIGKGDLLSDRLLTFDALKMEFRNMKIKNRAECPVCGENPQITTLIDYEQTVCDLKL